MQRSESRRKAALSNFSDEGIEGQLGKILSEFRRKTNGIRGSVIADGWGLAFGTASGIWELFIITKAGILIRHYSDSLRTDVDRDILSGMLVAVQEFVKQTLSSKAGNLDELRYGTYTVHFVRGLHTIAAAVAKDMDAEHVKYAVSDALQDFEDRYAGILPTWNGDVAEFAGVDECFEKVLKA